MTDPSGSYRFLAWARRGLATTLTGAPDASGRARLDIELAITKDATADTVKVPLHFYGPGDVVGIDQRQVIRTDPVPYTPSFEPNYFPSIEFDTPEYPWLFSPDPPGTRVRPWLCLVVVQSDVVGELQRDPGRPLPWLKIPADHAPAELPDLAEAWAWAHAQLAGTKLAAKTALQPDQPPERTLSRLLCPRRLVAGHRYRACVVPTFRAGREAGLGQPITPGVAPAWPPGDSEHPWPEPFFELPVYHHWEFTTGPVGDFEFLARRLDGRRLGDAIGAREMDLTQAGSDLPVPAAGQPGSALGLEGALCSAAFSPSDWPEDPREAFQDKLRSLLETNAGSEPLILTPPLYGSHQATRGDVAASEWPRWLSALNLDPRYRAAAGLGARVVQELQEQLVASAWDQVGALERANALLREAQLARSAAATVHERRLRALPADAALRVTGPVHTRVCAPMAEPSARRGVTAPAGRTLAAEVAASTLPSGAVAPPFQRAVRPTGPLGRWLPGAVGEPVAELTEGLAADTVAVPVRPAAGAVDFDKVGKGVALGSAHQALERDDQSGYGFVRIAPRTGEDPEAVLAFYRGHDPFERAEATPLARAAPPTPPVEDEPPVPEDSPPRRSRVVGINRRFRQAASALLREVQMPPPAPTDPPVTLALDVVASSLTAAGGALDPEHTITQGALARLGPALRHAMDDPLLPRAAAVRFPQPMSLPLRALDPDVLLPGAELIEPDTVGVLVGNARFIEAYMVGLSHELGRELLWRGLPADYGATFFEQFWDTRGSAGSGSTDIPAIGGWHPDAALGENATRVGGDGMLVLLVRGELLRRYPTTPVYAVRGERDGDDWKLGTEVRRPEFRGLLDPDIVFMGFPLTDPEARGSASDPGWFFVLEQQPTAPRFGLDVEPDDAAGAVPPTGSWLELHWGHLGRPGDKVSELTHAPVAGRLADEHLVLPVLDADHAPAGGTVPSAEWGTDAAQMAAITYQPPMRIAIHAAQLLPKVP